MSRPEPKVGTRPFVQVNCAVSADGKLAYADGARARLSGPEDLERVQALRADSDAILVGAGTVRLDDPSLRVHWELLHREPGREPLRVILASSTPLPATARVLDGRRPTLLAVPRGTPVPSTAGVEALEAGESRVDLALLLDHLHRRGIRRLLVEGGSRVLASFFEERLVDRCTVYVAPLLIGDDRAPPMIAGRHCSGPSEVIPLTRRSVESLDDGLLLTFERPVATAHPL